MPVYVEEEFPEEWATLTKYVGEECTCGAHVHMMKAVVKLIADNNIMKAQLSQIHKEKLYRLGLK